MNVVDIVPVKDVVLPVYASTAWWDITVTTATNIVRKTAKTMYALEKTDIVVHVKLDILALFVSVWDIVRMTVVTN